MKYKLEKGRHYALTIYYIGGSSSELAEISKCSLFDLTLSVSHAEVLMHDTRCPEGGSAQNWSDGLPKRITDNDIDRNGVFFYEKVL
jgi:hypothetical protein